MVVFYLHPPPLCPQVVMDAQVPQAPSTQEFPGLSKVAIQGDKSVTSCASKSAASAIASGQYASFGLHVGLQCAVLGLNV